jgi:hypothetical protein
MSWSTDTIAAVMALEFDAPLSGMLNELIEGVGEYWDQDVIDSPIPLGDVRNGMPTTEEVRVKHVGERAIARSATPPPIEFTKVTSGMATLTIDMDDRHLEMFARPGRIEYRRQRGDEDPSATAEILVGRYGDQMDADAKRVFTRLLRWAACGLKR